ncbi:hypothetical protein DYB32_007788 [Aphanomyces invadans]|uniref:Uncharacterized protein n=1 Tax=Aphanomyces invadans TaxID=157072 RepID=A0A418B008_9STRA|nr:hypothetical protein DYB32_007788 [Aphanomyces invadans]
MLPSTSPATSLNVVDVDENDVESMNSLYSAKSTNPEGNDGDSIHCQYSESAIVVDGASTPSYCRSNASPRAFLHPLSADVGHADVSNTTNVATVANSSNKSISSITADPLERASSNSTLGPNNSCTFTSNATVGTCLWECDDVTSMRVQTGAASSSIASTAASYVNASLPYVMPFALVPADSAEISDDFDANEASASVNTDNAAPPFYFDDEQYEEHVNIWASRVWTSSSEKEDGLESFFHTIDDGTQAQQHSFKTHLPTVASTSSHAAWLQAIAEFPEAPPHHVTQPLSSSALDPHDVSNESRSILSPVLQAKLANGSLAWHDQVFLLPHEPLRRAMVTIRRLVHLTYLPYEAAARKMPAFFAWFDHFAQYVHTQCNVKANVMLPAILGVNPSLRELLVTTVKSHEAVLTVLDAIKYFQTSMPEVRHGAAASPSDAPDEANHGEMAWASYILQLSEYIETLEHILSATLDRDEGDFGKALASTFNHESYTRHMQKRIETALSSQDKRVMVPWMLDGCDRFGGCTEDWQWGWWSKVLYNMSWRRYYTSHVVVHLHTLESTPNHCEGKQLASSFLGPSGP